LVCSLTFAPGGGISCAVSGVYYHGGFFYMCTFLCVRMRRGDICAPWSQNRRWGGLRLKDYCRKALCPFMCIRTIIMPEEWNCWLWSSSWSLWTRCWTFWT